MKKETNTIEIPDGFKACWVDNGNGQKILTLFKEDEATDSCKKEDNRPVTERIKTFEDALNVLSAKKGEFYEQLIDEYKELQGHPAMKDLVAYTKLRIIVASLNEGWQPTFNPSEYRYYPYFYLYTKEEYEKLSDDAKKELWLFGGSSNDGSVCGLASARSDSAWTNSAANRSARLALKSRELAIYCGKQFIDIWADYVFL